MKTLQYKTEDNGDYDLITVYDEDGKIFTKLEVGKFSGDIKKFFTDEEKIQLYLDNNGYEDESFTFVNLNENSNI